MNFKETNNGRILKSFKDDCVIRSISLLLDKPYADVFHEMMELGMHMGAYPNHPRVYEKYLKNNGCIKNKPPRDDNGKPIKLRNWANAPSRAAVINSGNFQVRQQLTAVIDNCVMDTWDCRERPVNSYFTKQGDRS